MRRRGGLALQLPCPVPPPPSCTLTLEGCGTQGRRQMAGEEEPQSPELPVLLLCVRGAASPPPLLGCPLPWLSLS